ncbi:hypothetical protein BFJ66_g17921, partial [Fusarium oxysporum f. sp. cepae]
LLQAEDAASSSTHAVGDEYSDWFRDVHKSDQNILDPISYWYERREEYPRLSQMALDVLSVLPMSADVERLFSTCGRMVRDDRARLDASTIGMTQTVRSWHCGGYIKSTEKLLEDVKVPETDLLAEMSFAEAREATGGRITCTRPFPSIPPKVGLHGRPSILQEAAWMEMEWTASLDPSNAEKPALSKPEEPTVQQIRPTASDLTDLTAEEFRRLEFLHTQYRTKVQTHRDQQKALSSIQQHIVKTIGNYYSTIADEHDIAKELALLKARVQPTDWAHEQEVLERYYAVLKAPNRSKIDTWITSWQRILTEAQKLDLPDIKNLRPTRQFLQAVSSINPAFTDYWINKMEDEARNKPNWQDSFPDGIKISEIFERSHKAKRATGSKAVFSTFQNEGPNQSNNGYNDGDKGSNRRSKPSCLCGKKHYYSECYYLSKAARPNGWKPNKDIEHKINQKLEDPVLKEKVNRSLERYAGQRPQEPQAVQDHQNSADVRGTAFAGRHVTQEAQRSTFATSVYPLKDSFILDSGSDTHICNNKDRFVSYEPLTIEEVAYAGDSQLSILGYGQVHLRLEEGGIFILNEVAHIPAFHTNVASLDRMINKGYNWNPQTGAVTAKGKIVFHTKRINRQPVIEFNPVRPQQAPSAFSSSSEPRPEQVQEAARWHQRLGHLNPEALEQLVRHTTGARIKGPIRIDCRPCSEAKATRIISRRGPHAKAPRPFWRIYIDVFHLHESYNGKKTALLIKDEFTGMIFAYFHTEATQAALLAETQTTQRNQLVDQRPTQPTQWRTLLVSCPTQYYLEIDGSR